MRAIKFRGKRLYGDQWIQGDFILLDRKAHIYERKNELCGYKERAGQVVRTTIQNFSKSL